MEVTQSSQYGVVQLLNVNHFSFISQHTEIRTLWKFFK